jgi:hypothetical protein
MQTVNGRGPPAKRDIDTHNRRARPVPRTTLPGPALGLVSGTCQRYRSAGTHSPWLRTGSRAGRWMTASGARRPNEEASRT